MSADDNLSGGGPDEGAGAGARNTTAIGLGILGCFDLSSGATGSAAQPKDVGEIARRTGFSKSEVEGVLAQLTRLGYMEQSTRGYRLSALALGASKPAGPPGRGSQTRSERRHGRDHGDDEPRRR